MEKKQYKLEIYFLNTSSKFEKYFEDQECFGMFGAGSCFVDGEMDAKDFYDGETFFYLESQKAYYPKHQVSYFKIREVKR